MARTISGQRSPRKSLRWAAAAGGNRLDRLHQLLIGDQNHVASLAEDDPRRRPTVARVRFLERASS